MNTEKEKRVNETKEEKKKAEKRKEEEMNYNWHFLFLIILKSPKGIRLNLIIIYILSYNHMNCSFSCQKKASYIKTPL